MAAGKKPARGKTSTQRRAEPNVISDERIQRAQALAIKKYLRPKHPDSKPQLRNADPRHNVVGVGIARKRTKGRDKAVGVTLYVRQKLSPEELKQWPRKHLLPKAILGVPIDVMQAAAPEFLSGPPRPAKPGAMLTINQPNGMQQFGTYGALVEDDSGRRYALSNNHVLSNFGANPAGIRVFQPEPPARFARLTLAVPIDPVNPNDTDCAIARLDSPGFGSGVLTPPIGPLSSTVQANLQPGRRVMKRGAVTDVTKGKVHSPALAVDLGGFHFENLVQIEDVGGAFCDHGDSGSLIVDSANRPVGLLIGRMGTFSFACTMDRVLARLSAALGSNLRLITTQKPLELQTP